jgi:hypothetical protein
MRLFPKLPVCWQGSAGGSAGLLTMLASANTAPHARYRQQNRYSFTKPA